MTRLDDSLGSDSGRFVGYANFDFWVRKKQKNCYNYKGETFLKTIFLVTCGLEFHTGDMRTKSPCTPS